LGREALATRDAVGERTTYFAQDSRGTLQTAERLRTLRPLARGVDPEALRDYLTCAFVPGARTLYDGVRELRPGQTLYADGSLEDGPEVGEGTWPADDPLERHARRLRPILDAAVRSRLPADPDEPVGVYLSGGLDSSLVTALVKRLHPGPVHTFAIHFGPQYANELPFSQMVAEHCRTIHHVLELSIDTIRKDLTESIAALDDPIGDPLTTPNLLLGKAARAQGLATIFNGEGGDPCFGGPKNLPMLLHTLYDPTGQEDVRRAYFRSYQKCYDDLPALLSPDIQKALASRPPQEELLTPFLADDAPMASYLNRLMRINVRLKGADQILTKVHNLTRHCGLIGQSPLFDPAIVAAGFAIPPAYKLDGTREKAVLKEAVRDLLPEAILARPKSGMMVPVQRWFRDTPLRNDAKDLLFARRSRIRPFLQTDLVRDWWDYKPLPFPRHGVKLWLILTLELWLRENGF
jgi:asparagine synthase (glutamine-hydrolysing)